MASCCRSGPCEQMFKPRTARRDLKRYRKKGLDGLESRMVEAAGAEGLAGARVLEIGGGIGKLQSELLQAGAAHGEIVELVSAYEPFARELAAEKGIDDRVSFRVGDVLAGPQAFEPADVVVLNRVVCCTPDGIELAGAAARLTRGTLVLSFPRDVRLVRALVRLLNVGLWAMRRSFRTFVHSPAAIIAAAEAAGLRPVERDHDGAWEFTALRRA